MRKFKNPLDKIKIASPCAANWDEMRGDARRRFYSECGLSVYDLSAMTRTEAENFLIKAEGRVCVKFYRRRDGTVLTQDCPVGLQALKRKISRASAAVFAVIAGFFGGIFALETGKSLRSLTNYEKVPEPLIESKNENGVSFGIYGTLNNLPEIKAEIFKSRNNL